jgi:Bacterial lectin
LPAAEELSEDVRQLMMNLMSGGARPRRAKRAGMALAALLVFASSVVVACGGKVVLDTGSSGAGGTSSTTTSTSATTSTSTSATTSTSTSATTSISTSATTSSTNGTGGFGGGPPLCVTGATQGCYDGPAGTEGVGVCHAGTQTCMGTPAGWGPCEGEVTPQPPDCDGIDHTCTGVIVACNPGTTCGTSISGPSSPPSTSWSFNGSAAPVAGAGLLTTNGGSEAGTIFYGNSIVTDSFTASFQIQLGNADGGTFVLQNNGATAVGNDGGGLGVAGLVGYAIELDTYDNSECGDPDDDHVGLDVLGPTCSQAEQQSFWTASLAPFGVNLHDGAWHTAAVTFAGGTVTLVLDGQTVIPGIALPDWVSGTPYWYGFSGSSGEATGQQGVRNAQIQFPTPRCL